MDIKILLVSKPMVNCSYVNLVNFIYHAWNISIMYWPCLVVFGIMATDCSVV
jgi:hypothetical protein